MRIPKPALPSTQTPPRGRKVTEAPVTVTDAFAILTGQHQHIVLDTNFPFWAVGIICRLSSAYTRSLFRLAAGSLNGCFGGEVRGLAMVAFG
ncbi:MAG: hypothetical protein FWE28_01770 [Oscillospiraceae bacterium]|nr:hypothetical protein [Oscillospiraceae bacterium]